MRTVDIVVSLVTSSFFIVMVVFSLFLLSFLPSSPPLGGGEEGKGESPVRFHGHRLTEEDKRLNREYLDEIRKVR
jgi:hypothetical protein